MIKPAIMKIILFILLQFFYWNAFSQLGNLLFGSDGDDCIYEMIPSPDGNYYCVGTKTLQIPQVWLMKVTPAGELLWEKSYAPYNDAEAEHGYSVNVFPDGSLILTGEVTTDETFNNLYGMAIKTTADGELVWKKRYDDISTIFDAVPSANGILFGGWNDNTGSSDSGILLFAQSDGEPLTRVEVDIYNQNYVKKIFPIENGHFLLAGRSNVIGVGFGGIFIRKITGNGDEVWTATNNTDFDESLFAWQEDFYPPLGAFVDADGNITVVNPNGYFPDIKVMRFTKNGALIDERIYGDQSIQEFPSAIIQLDDKGFLIAGSTAGGGAFALRTTETGSEEWLEYFSLSNSFLNLYDAEETDNRFLLGGRYQDNIPGNSDFDGLILAIEKDGNRYPFSIKGRVIMDENFNCQYDPGEVALPQWFVDVSGQSRVETLMSDENGVFEYRTDEGVYNFNLFNRDVTKWNICSNSINITSNTSNPLDSFVFLVQPIDICPEIRVSLTHPALIRCDTSCFTASVLNDGTETSGDQLLTIELDPELTLISASKPYTLLDSKILFEIEPIQRWQFENIELCVKLDCDVQLGATHDIKATIADACLPIYSGPRYSVNGACEGGIINFRLKNTGGGGSSATTIYSAYADGLIIDENIPITLPQGGTETIISFPADGRTWRIILAQDPAVPDEDYPTDVVEGCGVQNNGLHSIAFKNGFRANDIGPSTSIRQTENTLTVPNKVFESTSGLGFYNFINSFQDLEYTARVRNPHDHNVSEVSLDLTFSPTLDPRTFRLFSAPAGTVMSFPQQNTIRLITSQIILEPDADYKVSFSVQAREGLHPDSAGQSLFLVDAKAYLDKVGPVDLFPAFNNYSLSAPVHIDEYNTYPEEYKLFGGRNYEFGICMATGADGSMFVAGESNSYNSRSRWDGYVAKTNRYGEAVWLTAIDDGRNGFNSVRGISGLADGGCIVAGVSVPGGIELTLQDSRIHMARLDADGKIVWSKIIHPGTPAWTSGMIKTSDNQFVIYGVTRNLGSDQFYIKVNEHGEIVWSNFQDINGSYFDPTHGIALSDGSCVFVGTNNSTVIDVDVFVEKISASGQILWNTEYQSLDYIYLGGIAEGKNAELMITGESQWAASDTQYVITPTFIKMNGDGDVLWERSPIIGPFGIARAACIIPASDGGYLAGGEIYADTSEHYIDMMLMKIDDEAEVLWYGNYGAKNSEGANAIASISDNEIFLWGHNQPRSPYNNLQGVLVKTNGQGELVFVSPEIENPSVYANAFIFPNPTTEVINVVLSPKPINDFRWMICDMMGKILLRGEGHSDDVIRVETSNLSSGSYIITFPGTIYPAKAIVIVR